MTNGNSIKTLQTDGAGGERLQTAILWELQRKGMPIVLIALLMRGEMDTPAS